MAFKYRCFQPCDSLHFSPLVQTQRASAKDRQNHRSLSPLCSVCFQMERTGIQQNIFKAGWSQKSCLRFDFMFDMANLHSLICGWAEFACFRAVFLLNEYNMHCRKYLLWIPSVLFKVFVLVIYCFTVFRARASVQTNSCCRGLPTAANNN